MSDLQKKIAANRMRLDRMRLESKVFEEDIKLDELAQSKSILERSKKDLLERISEIDDRLKEMGV